MMSDYEIISPTGTHVQTCRDRMGALRLAAKFGRGTTASTTNHFGDTQVLTIVEPDEVLRWLDKGFWPENGKHPCFTVHMVKKEATP